MIHLQNIHKTFNDKLVLDIPDWRIEKGIFWIQGANGAGKSTLFRIIAGMLGFEGKVMIDNQYDQHKHPLDYRRRVTLAEAEPVYPSFLTPRNLLQFVSKTRQAPDTQMEELSVRLGISSFIDQPFSTFSSGMLKKVSLAMAFIGTPSLIILDEPLITIDKETRGLLYDLIREKALKSTGFLLSSHQAFTREDLPVRGIFEVKNHTLVEIGQV